MRQKRRLFLLGKLRLARFAFDEKYATVGKREEDFHVENKANPSQKTPPSSVRPPHGDALHSRQRATRRASIHKPGRVRSLGGAGVGYTPARDCREAGQRR